MKKDQEIENVMNSLDAIKRAEPGPFLYDRILSRIQAPLPEIPMRMIWAAAASFVIILMLNIWVIRSQKEQREMSAMKELARSYNLMNTSTISYN
jgi:hypothetical protein